MGFSSDRVSTSTVVTSLTKRASHRAPDVNTRQPRLAEHDGGTSATIWPWMTHFGDARRVALATLIRSRQVSSREVVEAHLDRIEDVNATVNAVTVTLADDALAAADEADRVQGTGAFHGVPFTIKENIDCTGSPTTQGVPALADRGASDRRADRRTHEGSRRDPARRTNLPEFGLRISTDNPLRGRTNNPWHLERTAGGSSGGEGAALATGMSPFGLGNDIGGSVRNPAFCCGITSLKPTPGRLPMGARSRRSTR